MALVFICAIWFPALTGWARFCRADGAGARRVGELRGHTLSRHRLKPVLQRLAASTVFARGFDFRVMGRLRCFGACPRYAGRRSASA
jgi:hypothetical protein